MAFHGYYLFGSMAEQAVNRIHGRFRSDNVFFSFQMEERGN